MDVDRTSLRRLGILAVLACLLACVAASGARADAQADYDNGYALGSKAYEYGIPLLDTSRIYRTATSVSKSDGRGDAPVNRFSHARKLASPDDKTVVAPNHDTLYSLAWLDLSRQPQVLHVPRMHSFFAFEMVSPWTENFRNISTATGNQDGGDFAIVGPGFRGDLPHGLRKIRSPYDRVWLIGRTLVKGEADVDRVKKIQNSYRLTPLSRYGTSYKPAQIRPVDTTVDQATIPGMAPGDDPLDFYAALSRELNRFTPPAADQPLLDELRAIDLGPGLESATNPALSADTLRGMRDAVSKGPDNIQAKVVAHFVAEFAQHNGYLIGDVGHYGTNYELRAMTDKIGVGALKPKIAIYAFAQTARDLSPLTGNRRYVLHIPASRLPVPAQGFWSLTLYDAQMFFFSNPFGRYVVNDRSDLHYNADGSLDLYVQPDQPADPQQANNWLPTPADGSFRLVWRLYDTGEAKQGILDGSGWQPPAVLACDTGGLAAGGTPCAS